MKELQPTSGWLVLDYGDVSIQMMTPAMRSYYKLEKRWKDGEVCSYLYNDNCIEWISDRFLT